ncbi:hypothetical protein K435DRAFT_799224 [Dendrothele bispora CBS 962.96]|uniref:HNH nuclease domain-containing protein n=1 Tax=Dendrothele bispora (strain CBS 962.96) TaxID=1314807 RepID=A0A4S8LWM2_DENBC|nr:hypothetical protein K435DRAFT_799224 [Dendrothele bispora CBS 962.96]
MSHSRPSDIPLTDEKVRSYVNRASASNDSLAHIVVKLPLKVGEIKETIVFSIPTHIIELATNYPAKYILHLMYCLTRCKGQLVWDTEESTPCDDNQLRQVWHTTDKPSWPMVRFVTEGPDDFLLLDPCGCDDRITASIFPTSERNYHSTIDKRDGGYCVISGKNFPGMAAGSVLDKAHIVPGNKKNIRLTEWATKGHDRTDPMYAVIRNIHDPRNILTMYNNIHTLCKNYNWGFTLLRVPNEYLNIEDMHWNSKTHEHSKPYPSGEMLYLFHPLHSLFDPEVHPTLKMLEVQRNGVVKPSADLTIWPTHALFDYWFGDVAMLYWADREALIRLAKSLYMQWYPQADEDSSSSFDESGEENREDEDDVYDDSDASTTKAPTPGPSTYHTGSQNKSANNDRDDWSGNILMWIWGAVAEQKEKAASIAKAADWVRSQGENVV